MVINQYSLARRLIAAAVLAIGFGTLWLVLAAWIGTSALESWPGGVREILVVANDGTPLIQSYPLDNLSKITHRDLDGRDRGDVDQKDLATPVHLYAGREPFNVLSSRLSWPERIKVFLNDREPAAVWYFIHDGRAEGSGEFVGYERVSNRRIGHVGLAGFRTGPLPADERFPVRGEVAGGYANWSSMPTSIYSGVRWAARAEPWDVPPRLVHVPSGSLLRVVDLAARTTTTVFEAPAPISSVGIPYISSWGGSEPENDRPILVRAGDRIYKLDQEYKAIGVVAIPVEVGDRASVIWYEADGGRAVVQCSLPATMENPLGRTIVYRIAADGTIQGSSELRLRNGSFPRSERAEAGMLSLCLPVPSALVAVDAFTAAERAGPGDFATRLGGAVRRSWPWPAAVLAVSIVLAAVAWRRGRAFGLSRRERNAWAAFVLFLGAPGFVGFLLHRRWPVREPCPHCHARVPRDRDACAACGTPFPPPAPRGTEIFA